MSRGTPHPTRPRVLLVDDDPAVLCTAAALLEDDYEVISAGSGRDALAAAKAHPPDVVCTDLSMPGMSGLELLARVAREWPDASGVLVTAHRDLLGGKDDGDRPACPVLFKPYTEADLRGYIARAANRARLNRASRELRRDAKKGVTR